MCKRERQGWIIVASLWITMFLVYGSGTSTGGIFFTPLLREFRISRAQLSTLQASCWLLSGLTAPLIGWLLDRVEARIVMISGIAISSAALLFASQVRSFALMLAAYMGLGIGIGASTIVPCALVVANWFGANRGFAMAMMFTGQALGSSTMNMVANYAIQHGGWRSGYITLALPMLVIVVPVVLIVVRSRPEEVQNVSIHSAGDNLPGFELREAIRTRSFWMIMTGQFFFGCVVVAVGLHLVPYLIGIGYSATSAAGFLSICLGLSAVGKFMWGLLADRVTARVALCIDFLAEAVGLLLIHGAANPVFLMAFVIIYGIGQGSPVVLLALVTADSLGLKRYGSITGVTNMLLTLGAAVGPVLSGRIFDVTGSYAIAFDILCAMYVIAALAALACRPLKVEQSRMTFEAAA